MRCIRSLFLPLHYVTVTLLPIDYLTTTLLLLYCTCGIGPESLLHTLLLHLVLDDHVCLNDDGDDEVEHDQKQKDHIRQLKDEDRCVAAPRLALCSTTFQHAPCVPGRRQTLQTL